ncbi:MAG: AMP-binding protein [Acidimicrobiales bacterium]
MALLPSVRGGLMDLLTAHAQATPDKVAVVDDRPGQEPRQMTFAEFNACANRLANGIVDARIDAGAKVMWLGQNSLEVASPSTTPPARRAPSRCRSTTAFRTPSRST